MSYLSIESIIFWTRIFLGLKTKKTTKETKITLSSEVSLVNSLLTSTSPGDVGKEKGSKYKTEDKSLQYSL